MEKQRSSIIAAVAGLRRSPLAFRLNQRRLRYEARRGLPKGVIRAARDRRDRVLALSYDDGPSPANTPELLDILGAAGARATFFAVGSEVARHPELVAGVAAAGHELGSHSFTHAHPKDLSDAGLRSEIERGTSAIAEITRPPRLYRPPYGKRPREAAGVCASLGLLAVLWSIDSGDTMPFSTDEIADEVVGNVEPGDIVLLHDGGDRRQRTLDATRAILDRLGGQGYRFVTVSELLDEA